MSTLGCLVAPGLGVGWGWDLGLGEACVPGEVARRSGAIAPWGRGTTRPGRRCDASAICRVTRGGAVPPPWERAGDTDGGGWLDRELDRFPGGGRWSSCCWSRWSPASASCRGGSGGPPRRRATPWAEPGRRSPTRPLPYTDEELEAVRAACAERDAMLAARDAAHRRRLSGVCESGDFDEGAARASVAPGPGGDEAKPSRPAAATSAGPRPRRSSRRRGLNPEQRAGSGWSPGPASQCRVRPPVTAARPPTGRAGSSSRGRSRPCRSGRSRSQRRTPPSSCRTGSCPTRPRCRTSCSCPRCTRSGPRPS